MADQDVVRVLAAWALVHEMADEGWKAAVGRGMGGAPEEGAGAGDVVDGVSALIFREKERLKAELAGTTELAEAAATAGDAEVLSEVRFELGEMRGRLEAIETALDALVLRLDSGGSSRVGGLTMTSRLGEIRRVAIRHALRAAAGARFGLAPAPRRREAVAVELRQALEELGPTFVKLGQIGSVRADVFSPEVLSQLEKLQDDVAPVASELIAATILRSFGRDTETLYDSFDEMPLASASIAQVHTAVLRDEYRPVFGGSLPAGTRLAVKVVRPGARAAIRSDVAAARGVLRRVPRLGSLARIDLPSLVDELDASLARELDMRIEGRTADRFAHDFRHDPLVQVPRVVWPLTSRDVLTMEFVDGWPLSRLDEARAAGVDTHALAEHGAEAFMRQVLVAGRYHADLHHANLLVTPQGRIAYLDFGMVGHLDAGQRTAVAHLLAALVYRDPDSALLWTEALGVDIPREKAVALSRDLGGLMDHTLVVQAQGGSDLKDFGLGLLTLLRRYDVQVASGYGLLVKGLVTVEGVSRRLYPDIDMMAMAAPFVTALLVRDALRPESLNKKAPEAARAALAVLLGE